MISSRSISWYHPNKDDSFSWHFRDVNRRPDICANFLVAIREDSVAKLDVFSDDLPILENRLQLDHLDKKSAQQAILRPVDRYNKLFAARGLYVKVEETLPDVVLHAVEVDKVNLGEFGEGAVRKEKSARGQRSAIEAPFLQLVMMRLWEEEIRGGSGKLRSKTLENLGGAKQIVRQHLNKIMKGLKLDQRRLAAQLFQYLVTPGGRKIAHGIDDLVDYLRLAEGEDASTAKQIEPVLRTLCEPRLRVLRDVTPAEEQQPRFEIYHDVLALAIRDWRAQFADRLKRVELRRASRLKLKQEREKAEQEKNQALEKARVAAEKAAQAAHEAKKQLEEQQKLQELAARELQILKKYRGLRRAIFGVSVLAACVLAGTAWEYYHRLHDERATRAAIIENTVKSERQEFLNSRLQRGRLNDPVFVLQRLAQEIRNDRGNSKAVILCSQLLRDRNWARRLATYESIASPNASIVAATFTSDHKAVALRANGSFLTYDGGAEIIDPSKVLPGIDRGSVISFAAFSPNGTALLLKQDKLTVWKSEMEDYKKIATLDALPVPSYRRYGNGSGGKYDPAPATCSRKIPYRSFPAYCKGIYETNASICQGCIVSRH